MEEYHNLLRQALSGERCTEERTGAGTVGVFQRQGRWNLAQGLPIVTTKPTYFRGIKEELLWFLRGETNIRPLLQQKVGIWSSDSLRHNLERVVDANVMTMKEVKQAQHEAQKQNNFGPAQDLITRYEQRVLEDEDFAMHAADLGPVYGAQWRGTNGATSTDQVISLENDLRKGGASRYMIVDAWNPVDRKKQALPACHMMWQAHVSPESRRLTLGWYQRSCDTVLGVPFNIASYGLLANMLAKTHDLGLGEVVGTFADLHVYLPHIPAAEEQLAREPFPLPEVIIKNKRESVTEYQSDDIELVGYKHRPKLSHPTPMFGGFF